MHFCPVFTYLDIGPMLPPTSCGRLDKPVFQGACWVYRGLFRGGYGIANQLGLSLRGTRTRGGVPQVDVDYVVLSTNTSSLYFVELCQGLFEKKRGNEVRVDNFLSHGKCFT